jgi:hypothetical protein
MREDLCTGPELHVFAEIVTAFLAIVARPAKDSDLDGDSRPDFQGSDALADSGDNP